MSINAKQYTEYKKLVYEIIGHNCILGSFLGRQELCRVRSVSQAYSLYDSHSCHVAEVVMVIVKFLRAKVA